MIEAYIFDAIRTPIGKGSKSGALSQIKPVELLSQLYSALEQRNAIQSTHIEAVALGCVGQIGEQGANIAKISTLYHGWSHHIDGFTINGFCTSALTAIGLATAKVRSGMNAMVIAGGVEMLSQVPMFADKGSWFNDTIVSEKSNFTHMGVSADLIASLEGFSREQLDNYALQTHNRAASANEKGYFQPSLIPVTDHQNNPVLSNDECIRPDLNHQQISQLKPLFEDYLTTSIRDKIKQRYPQLKKLQHLHHQGNSPVLADAASMVLIGSLQRGKALGLTPKAKIKAYASTSCEPIIMLLGGQQAIQNAIEQAGLQIKDIDLHFYAEAFSATCLKYQRDLAVDNHQFNPNGGTLALGHAQGSSGGMLTATLIDEMKRQDIQFGVTGISGGAGIGAGLVIENI